MSWKTELRKGSFRGVPFFVTSADDGAGRRRAQHIYAGREQPFSEDVGRKQREYTLSVYCLGADYFNQRDALEKALNEPGPGLLVHPWRGELHVTVDYRVQHSTADGGMCTFTLNCTEAGHNENPERSIDTSAGLLSAIDSSKLSILDKFKDRFSISGFSDFVKSDAITELSQFAAMAAAMPGQLNTVSSDNIMSDLTPLMADSGELGNAVYSLVSSTGKLSKNFRTGGSSEQVTTAVKTETTSQGVASLQTFYNYQPVKKEELYPTTTGMQSKKNAEAISSLIKESAGVESAKKLAESDYKDAFLHREEANNAVNATAQHLQQLSFDASDEQYKALNATRIALLNDYRSRAIQLASIKQIELQQTEPALLIAYREYADVSRESEILKINNIPHPGFVAGGQPLELLNV